MKIGKGRHLHFSFQSSPCIWGLRNYEYVISWKLSIFKERESVIKESEKTTSPSEPIPKPNTGSRITGGSTAGIR